jgi:CheY-like chemotaxis protein
MAEPALREQLSNYITRRVTTQAEAVVDIYQACSENDWHESEQVRQLIDTSEKLAKLSKKLPHRPFVDSARKISSLLKLGSLEDKPSSKALKGMTEAMTHIRQQLEAYSLLDQKQPVFQITNICIATNERRAKHHLPESIDAIPIRHIDDIQNQIAPGTCFVIDIDYQKNHFGFELSAKLQKQNADIAIIFYSAKEPDFTSRMLAVRNQAKGLVVGSLNSRKLTRTINQAFNTDITCKPLIAVIDDSMSQLKYAENTLTAAQFECITISQPADLLSSLEFNEPDLLLLDMYLQDCNGIEVAKLLKQHPKWQNLPILFMSAEEDAAIVEEAKSLSNSPFLTKPAKPAILTREINKLLKRNKPNSI